MEEEPTIEDVTFELPPKEASPWEQSIPVFFPEEKEILIAGVFSHVDPDYTLALRDIDVADDTLRVEVQEVEKENPDRELVMTSGRPVAYEIYADFETTVPHRVEVKHYSQTDEVEQVSHARYSP